MSFKNKNIIRGFPFFTHFASLPFIKPQHRSAINQIQTKFQQELTQKQFKVEEILKRHSHLLSHVTLFKVTLKREQTKNKIRQILKQQKEKITDMLKNLEVVLGQIKYFTRLNKNEKCKEVTVIYIEIDEKSQQILNKLADYLIRIMLKHQVIVQQELKSMNVIYDLKKGAFCPQTFHLSLYRCRNLIYNQLKQLPKNLKLKFQVESLDISTMMEYDVDEFYLPFQRVLLKSQKKQNADKIMEIQIDQN